MKKIILSILLIAAVAVGALFLINGSSNYDPTKYSLSVTPKDKPFAINSKIGYTLPDQFDKAHSSSDTTKKLIFVFTKPTGHIIRTFMSTKDAKFLDSKSAVIVADVSAMPTVIRNTFALPDLRESKYPMLLIYDKNMAKRLKDGQDKDKVIIMTLDKSKVIKIEHASSVEDLGKLL